MAIPSSSTIRLKGDESEWLFRWSGFDLDDIFDLFQITVSQPGARESYDLGPCTVWGLRHLTRIFESQLSEDAAGGGFRNPDRRFYELRRHGTDYNLIIRFPEKGFEKAFGLSQPEVTIDRKFLDVYDRRVAY